MIAIRQIKVIHAHDGRVRQTHLEFSGKGGFAGCSRSVNGNEGDGLIRKSAGEDIGQLPVALFHHQTIALM
jgi:hypothetical protein